MSDLRTLYNKDPKSISKLFSMALLLIKEEKYDQAEAVLQRFVREFPDFNEGDIWYELADLLEKRGDAHGAEAAYREAVRYQPNYDIYLIAFGYFLWRNHKEGEAKVILTHLRALLFGSPSWIERVDQMLEALNKGVPYEDYNRTHPWEMGS